jgi:hypothetical protein
MKTGGKILGVLALIGGAFWISRLFKTANTGKKLSINVASLNAPTIKNGALALSANIVLDNPTDTTISLKKPYLTAFHNGNEVGNSIASNERIDIKANERTTIKGINIHIPFLELGTLAVSLIAGNIPKMEFEIEMKTEANGIPYTDKKPFKL